jgi:hypothetical protein
MIDTVLATAISSRRVVVASVPQGLQQIVHHALVVPSTLCIV